MQYIDSNKKINLEIYLHLLPGIRFVVFINKPCRHLKVTAAFIIGTTFLLKVDLQVK